MRQRIDTSSVWLDFIRGCAALAVFVGHARVLFLTSIVARVGLASPHSGGQLAGAVEKSTNFSHEAVIVFFVLSGYLVGGSVIRAMRRDRWSPRAYAIQRMTRLWTVLVPALLLTALLDQLGLALFGTGGIYGAPAGQGIVFADLAERSSFSTLLGNLFFLQIVLFKTFGTDSPLWTLSFEFWFYIAFPFLAWALRADASTRSRVWCCVALAAIAAFVGRNICTYFLFWLMGAYLEAAPSLSSPEKNAWFARLSGIAFLLVCVILVKTKPALLLSDAIEAAAFAVFCYALLQNRREKEASLFSRMSHRLSSLSYTLYLTHAPLLVFACAVVMKEWEPWPVSASGLLRFGGVLACVMMAVLALYGLFERNTAKVRILVTRAIEGRRGE